jgi:hypothetical protein
VLTIVTQISATTLIAGKIYVASRPFQILGEVEDGYGVEVEVEEAGMGDNDNDAGVVGEKKNLKKKKVVKKGGGKGGLGGRKYEPTQREKYLATVWLVVESGLIYSSAAIVQLVTYLLKMNASVIMEFMLGQLSVSVFFSFFIFFPVFFLVLGLLFFR